MSDYFHCSENKEADKRANEAIINRIYNEFNNFFSGIGCFEGTFSLQVKEHLNMQPQGKNTILGADQSIGGTWWMYFYD